MHDNKPMKVNVNSEQLIHQLITRKNKSLGDIWANLLFYFNLCNKLIPSDKVT